MPKYKLNDYHHDCYCDEIAKAIESENGYTERKNGTIWVKQPNVKGMGIISEIENTIRDVVHKRNNSVETTPLYGAVLHYPRFSI